MLIEHRSTTIETTKTNGFHHESGVHPKLVPFELPKTHNGKEKNGVNGKKINGVTRLNGQTEKSAAPRVTAPIKESELLKEFGDTVLFSDLAKSSEDTEMFQKVFGAQVDNDGGDVRFPQTNVRIGMISRKEGKALLATPVEGSKYDEYTSLNNAAVRDVEDDKGPALDFIFPESEDGSAKVVRLTKESVTKRVVKASSDAEDKVTLAIAKKLPKSSSVVVENRQFNKHNNPRLIPRDLDPLFVFPDDGHQVEEPVDVNEKVDEFIEEAQVVYESALNPLLNRVKAAQKK